MNFDKVYLEIVTRRNCKGVGNPFAKGERDLSKGAKRERR